MNVIATSTRALQWGPGVATPLPRVKLNTADSGGSTPLQTALAHKTPKRQRKASPHTVQVLPMSWTKSVPYVQTQPESRGTFHSAFCTLLSAFQKAPPFRIFRQISFVYISAKTDQFPLPRHPSAFSASSAVYQVSAFILQPSAFPGDPRKSLQ
jgi:hypothetical protein